ncbi:cytidylyltransferase family protein [Colletotrichum plurivorum]|uniref:Cytidylyltransferase family protein n=1 Tax=Colletotrichum plurivorum TaxID=2175906 RepID=A0A8H6K6K2_9PEZI|nr:cytidylyltransferase family protein [Colletotrichum plurivorum]
MSSSIPNPEAAMSSRKSLVELFNRSLSTFQTSSDAFRVVCTLPRLADSPSSSAPRQPRQKVDSLVVLDSSFNPPTLAHLRMARSALRDGSSNSSGGGARLLLLLAVNNADKKPKPASFGERLGMMHAFAEDLLEEEEEVEVDLGLTTRPYFHEKSAVIAEEGGYGGAEQVYLVGFDTLIRIFDGKYYDDMGAALGPFLGRARVRVTMRTDDAWGDEEEQEWYLEGLKDGGLEAVGGRAEWAERVEMVRGRGQGEEVVSSTRVREAAARGDGEGLKGLLSNRVREWVVEEGLYRE